jgi:cytochrome c biogenesis protein ResB
VVKQGTAIVNHPLTYGDLVFYQTGFGQAVVVRIANSDGSILFDDALPLIPFRSKLNPDAPAAHVELAPVGMTLTVIAPDENPTNAPELDTLNLRSGQMYFLLRPLTAASPITLPTGLVMTQGKTETLAGLSFTFVREKRATLLQVGRNPGIPIFLAAAFLLVGGLAITLYFPHRRIRGIIAGAAAGGSQATLAPLARRDWSGQRAFAQVVDRLEQRLGTPIERIVPSDEGQSANHDTTMATRS